MKENDNNALNIEVRLYDSLRLPSQAIVEEDCDRALARLHAEASSRTHERRDARAVQPLSWSRYRPLLAAAAAVALVAVVSAAFIRSLVSPRKVDAIVESAEGPVYRVHEGKTQLVNVGEKIDVGTPVRTERGAVLKLSDGARIEIHTPSELSLESASNGVNIRLKDGSLTVTAAKEPEANLYVQNQGVTVPVIGTIFQSTTPAVASPRAAPEPRFEVASVRRVEIPTINGGVPVFPRTGGIGTSDPHRISQHGAQLGVLISEAFGVRGELVTGPDWLGKERYDIEAIIPDGATKDQFNIMLQNLLRDRFHLRFHMDSKVLPVYVLRVSKNGPKLKEAVSRTDDAKTPLGAIDAQGFPVLPPNYHGSLSLPHAGELFLVAQDAPIANLVSSIGSPLGAGRPVIDETGLTGHYDFKIHFEYRRRSADVGVSSDPAPSVFDAVEAQLGLKLESASRSFDQLIIDSIDREPTEN